MRDVIIVGGGLVGLCAALVLRHPERRVSVVEAADLGQVMPTGLNARSIALATSSVQIFRALGIWSTLSRHAAPIRHIHISSRGRWGVTRLRAADYELESLGYVIEHQHLSQCLHEAALAAGIEILDRSEFTSLRQDSGVSIGFQREGEVVELQARLALVADGAQSPARTALGIGHQAVDYGQAVVIGNVEVDRPLDDTAYERFTDQGPLAMLPLGKGRYACVWTMDPDRAEIIGDLGGDEFCQALQTEFGFRLGSVENVGDRFTLPLRRVRADALHSGRCFVVGNAANALHPVAGQSFNLALRDVAELYELLLGCELSELDDPRLPTLGEEYSRRRLLEQARVIRYGDGLVSLFSNNLPVLNQARAAGLGLLDLVPALKTQVALSGMGLTFGGNRLLRGHL